MKSIRVQIAEENVQKVIEKISKLSPNQTEELHRLNSIRYYNDRLINEPTAAAAHAWTTTTNVLNKVLKNLAEINPIQVVSICDQIEKFLIEEGVITEQDIRSVL